MTGPTSTTGPTVSVVIPAYNRGATIDAALASVRGQIRPPDEVVVVDDESDDDTATRVESWVDQLPITLVRNSTNVGCGASRMRAVTAASGDVIAPLDGDDVWLPDHLSTVVPLATDASTIVATGYRRWQPNVGMDLHASSAKPVPPPAEQPADILRYNWLFSGSLAWRAAIMDIGGGSAARRADDWEVWIRLIVEGGCRAVPTPHATVLYRAHPGSLSVLDGCLPEELALCEDLLGTPEYAPYRSVLQAAVRRRRARQVFLRGARSAAAGDVGAARSSYAHALMLDPSLTGMWEPGTTGSVALRAAIGFMAPRTSATARGRRLRRKALVDSDDTDSTMIDLTTRPNGSDDRPLADRTEA